ncbi:MAG: recombinase family protein [Ruminiclostridium sp.]
MKKIIVIPPKPPEPKKLKTAAYCRVSTLGPAQGRSLDWQIKFYTKMITEHPNWIFTGVFFDAGKSGLRRKGRTGLDKMLKKAVKGKIYYIITKSISRVSRDTVEILKIIRYLRERSNMSVFANINA